MGLAEGATTTNDYDCFPRFSMYTYPLLYICQSKTKRMLTKDWPETKTFLGEKEKKQTGNAVLQACKSVQLTALETTQSTAQRSTPSRPTSVAVALGTQH